jgi:phosphoribosyl 1,2-cyclic phosphodiesterase
VIDALFPLFSHNTHFNLPQSLQFIERLQPRRALITGMSDLFEYHRDNEELQRRRRAGEFTVDVQLAFDGLRVPLNL